MIIMCFIYNIYLYLVSFKLWLNSEISMFKQHPLIIIDIDSQSFKWTMFVPIDQICNCHLSVSKLTLSNNWLFHLLDFELTSTKNKYFFLIKAISFHFNQSNCSHNN